MWLFFLDLELWTSSTSSAGSTRVHWSLPKQFTCVLWTWRRTLNVSFGGNLRGHRVAKWSVPPFWLTPPTGTQAGGNRKTLQHRAKEIPTTTQGTKKEQEHLKTALRTCGSPDWAFSKTSFETWRRKRIEIKVTTFISRICLEFRTDTDHRRTGAAWAVMWSLHWSIVETVEPKAEFLGLPVDFCSYPKRTNLRVQVKSSWIMEELGVELLLLCSEKSQIRWFEHLLWKTSGQFLVRFSGLVSLVRFLGSRKRWRHYISQLAWEHLGCPWKSWTK